MPSKIGKNFHLCFKGKDHDHSSLTGKDHRNHSISATASSSILINNLNSIFDDFSSSETDSTTLPDFSTLFASQRFFFSSPGLSNSIIDPPQSDPLVTGGIPIRTFSPDPYLDFRRSMQEMVDARHLSDVTDDWDSLHELLLCYLTLNPKHAHKFIIGAFADLLLSLTASTSGKDRPISDISDLSSVSKRQL